MKAKHSMTVIGIILAVLLAAPVVADRTLLQKQEIEYNVSAKVVPRQKNISVGVDAGRNMNFGKIPRKNNVTKFINISTGRTYNLDITVDGNISKYLKFKDSNKGTGTNNIPVEMVGAETGNYTGSLKLEITTPKNSQGETWMELKQKFF